MQSHNIGDIDNLKTFKYCYLNNIYKSNKIQIFELLLVDKLFTDFKLYLTVGKELKQLASYNGLIKDFSIVDGVLKCSSTTTLPLYEGIEKNLFKLVDISPEHKTLFDLFRQGALNKYIILEDKIVKEQQDSYVGSEIAKFTDIKFSTKTMSIYAKIITEEGLYNKMIVTMKNGKFNVSQFYFGVPISKDHDIKTMSIFDISEKENGTKGADLDVDIKKRFFGVDYCKTMNINGEDFNIYFVSMALLQTQTAMINALINKAASMCVKFGNICNALEFFISEYYNDAYQKQKKLEWIGGDSNYNDGIGVYFVNSRKTITKRDDKALLSFLYDIMRRTLNSDEIIIKIKNSGFSEDEKQIIMIYFSFLIQTNNPVELINLAYTYKNKIDLYNVCFSCYLYEMRLRIFTDDSFLLRNQTNLLEPVVITGSDEKGYTIINKCGNFLNI